MDEYTDATFHETVVPLSRRQAFHLFTELFADWWPKEYTWSQSALKTIGIEPKEGGRCTEEGPYGFQVDWGRVVVWEPPERLVLAWQIGPNRVPQPNPEHASTVEVRFSAEGPEATRLTIEHRDFRRHGEGAAEYRDGMASDWGWPFILERFRQSSY
ncbi:SRPBCC family protein [Billgrantia saliphila]|uniref:SRPBCC family protein n=1 Tax=Billgrantia saliphila TaxID=1848458 RepID=UPI000CE4DA33|nr:SRPBCC family protein [Halomonas saliphila]